MSSSEAPRRLPADQYCDACEARFAAGGTVGQCDHDFPGRPLRRFWILRELVEGEPRRYRIALCRATTFAEARATLEAPAGRQVSALVTRELFERTDGLARGEPLELEVERMPSAYDEWRRGDGTMDFRQMEDDGKDVR